MRVLGNVDHQASNRRRVLEALQGRPPLHERGILDGSLIGIPIWSGFQRRALILDVLHKFSAIALFEFAYLHAFENGTVRIGVASETAGKLDNRTQPFTFL